MQSYWAKNIYNYAYRSYTNTILVWLRKKSVTHDLNDITTASDMQPVPPLLRKYVLVYIKVEYKSSTDSGHVFDCAKTLKTEG